MTKNQTLKLLPPHSGESSDNRSFRPGSMAPSPVVYEQLSRRMELLNSQLVLYARDFRRLVDHQQRKTDELEQVRRQLDRANQQLKQLDRFRAPERDADLATQDQIVGQSPPLLEVMRLCRRVAPSMTNVLLTGETGTGKELVARWVHQHSPRHDQPFIAINCGALPMSLMESELFGHVRGAFTGADRDKAGLVELAKGGTLFLDEIGELPLSLQVKLLRLLEDRTYRKVGDTHEYKADIRVIAATNRILQQEVVAGRFRADLMYRLNVFPISLPPLRQRPMDIPLLVEHFLRQLCPDRDNPKELTEAALQVLMNYDWPGNVRELRNMIERACLLTEDKLIHRHVFGREIFQAASLGNPVLRQEFQDSPVDEALQEPPATQKRSSVNTRSMIAVQEKAMIINALNQANWNKAAAARALGISWDNLRYRIKKYGLTPPGNR